MGRTAPAALSPDKENPCEWAWLNCLAIPTLGTPYVSGCIFCRFFRGRGGAGKLKELRLFALKMRFRDNVRRAVAQYFSCILFVRDSNPTFFFSPFLAVTLS